MDSFQLLPQNGADLALGVGKQLVTTTVTDPTPGSDRAPSARETEISADLKHAGNVSATRKPPSAPLADAVAEAVGRAPGGAVGALSLAAAMFRVASGAVDEAANAASAPRRLNPAAEALRDDAAEGRGVQIAAAAAAAAAVGIATSGPSPPLPQPLLSASARLAADVAGARRAEALLQRAAARVVAAHETPVAVVRRMRTEALAGAARRARRAAACAAACAGRADAAAAALVRLPPDEQQDTSNSARAEDGFPPAPGARAPTPTPAAKRCVRAATVAASAALRARIAGGGPVGVSGRTRAATLRGTAVAVSCSFRPATEAGGAAAPAGVRDAAGASDAPHTSVDSCIWGGLPRRLNLTIGVSRAPPAPCWKQWAMRLRLKHRWRPGRRLMTRGCRQRPLLLPPPLATSAPNEVFRRWLAGAPRGRSVAAPRQDARLGTKTCSFFSVWWDRGRVGGLGNGP